MLIRSDKPSSQLSVHRFAEAAKELKSTTARSVEHRRADRHMGAGVPGAAASHGGPGGRAGGSGHLL